MKYTLYLFIFTLCVSCSEKQPTEFELVTEYFVGFKTSNYEQIKNVISDTLTTISGDYTTVFTPETYYQQFQWDSVFRPEYKLISTEQNNNKFIATISISCSKFEFLKNNPMICRRKFQFQSGKITNIEELDCSNVNWNIWAKEVETLVRWIENNHPELDGFVHDLSLKGAQNYLKAIELYKERVIE
ncbi:hypothetical protein ITJ86_05905 [Winogradskyella sp. F6397]|uniref:Lipoprotein n=1 Tax=Winogradskyella marina TaxID=2785530 RepID=A0ABS0EG39_9FLAO|nr:hypothetical protein [Winogradskyella marina]MBF8149421.1 hypothetical protein [Winogradskyella marina]